MTREEINKIHRLGLKYSEDSKKISTSMTVVKLGFVEKIVDEFLQNRTCENCKYFNLSEGSKKDGNGIDWIDCDLLYAERLNDFKDFGCNKWENKEYIQESLI